MEYPEELDKIHQKLATLNLATFELKEVNRLIERALRAGKAEQPDPLKGYSNLTAAISAGEPIDWDRLDGKRVQCVNPGVGELRGVLERDVLCSAERPGAWWSSGMHTAYIHSLSDAWDGEKGWVLYVEGEIPLRRKTADQLPVTTFFKGRRVGISGAGSFMCVGESENGKFILSAIDFLPSSRPAEEWEVLEEYGPFQKPEGK